MFGFGELTPGAFFWGTVSYSGFVLFWISGTMVQMHRLGPTMLETHDLDIKLVDPVSAVLLMGGVATLLLGTILLTDIKLPATRLLMATTIFTVAFSAALTFALLHYSRRLTARFSERWVKALDFPYLLFGFIGLIRVVQTSSMLEDSSGLQFINVAGFMFVSMALAIRLTKATLEVFYHHWYAST
jgi:hypothetical protein